MTKSDKLVTRRYKIVNIDDKKSKHSEKRRKTVDFVEKMPQSSEK